MQYYFAVAVCWVQSAVTCIWPFFYNIDLIQEHTREWQFLSPSVFNIHRGCYSGCLTLFPWWPFIEKHDTRIKKPSQFGSSEPACINAGTDGQSPKKQKNKTWTINSPLEARKRMRARWNNIDNRIGHARTKQVLSKICNWIMKSRRSRPWQILYSRCQFTDIPLCSWQSADISRCLVTSPISLLKPSDDIQMRGSIRPDSQQWP